ncbi:MAG: FAD-dependent oxidoreductase [Actinobacteria bacterium]|nr:FAD-dependent oxidoreductase [Actinomycetota bacterium]
MKQKKFNKNKSNALKILIIGGVAAGTSAAVKARRRSEKAEIVIYEKYKYISYGTCGLPYFVNGKIDDIDDLIINTVHQFEKRFNVNVKILHEVTEIDPAKKIIKVKDLNTGRHFFDNYDKLIITTGTAQLVIDEKLCNAGNTFSLRTIDEGLMLKDYIGFLTGGDKKEPESGIISPRPSAVIVGGGYIGLEVIDALLLKGFQVVVIEKMHHILPAFDFEIIEYLENYLADRGVKILKNTEISSFEQKDNNSVTSVITSNGQKIESDLVFLGMGARPDVRLARQCGLNIGNSEAISVNEYMQTSDPDTYAAGDCCECRDFVSDIRQSYYLASIANIQGRCAGYNAAGGMEKFIDSIPTSIIKVLDIAAAKTGISFYMAKKLNINAAKIELHALNHAGYYPQASIIHMLAVYDKDNGTILGFEAIGRDGVDKKTDIMSVVIRAKMKIWELLDLNLCYHPEYGSAKDPLNMLGMIGQNIKKGEHRFIDVEELKEILEKKEPVIIIDVRSEGEFSRGHIEGAINISIDDLRDNIKSLDRNSKIVVHCRTSYRSYLAYRILVNQGFKNVWNLNGSYQSWERKI